MSKLTAFNPFAQFGAQQPKIHGPQQKSIQPQQSNPFANAKSAGGPGPSGGGDPLSVFKSQMKSGELNLNPNQPRAGEGLGKRLNVSV